MYQRSLKALIVALVMVVVLVAPLAAQSYSMLIRVTSPTSYTAFPVMHLMSNTWLANNGFIQADGLDTRVTTSGGTEVPHMVAQDRTNFVTDIIGNVTESYTYSGGNEDLTTFPTIVGRTGYITVTDDPQWELGDAFSIVVTGYFYTTAGAKTVLIKPNGAGYAFKLWTSGTDVYAAVNDAEVSLTGAGLTASSTLQVTADGDDLLLYVNGVLADSDPLVNPVADTADDWILNQDALAYITAFTVTVGGISDLAVIMRPTSDSTYYPVHLFYTPDCFPDEDPIVYYTKVDEEMPDDNGTYIGEIDWAGISWYTLFNLSDPGVIGDVVFHLRVRATSTIHHVKVEIKTHDTLYDFPALDSGGTDHTHVEWNDYSYTSTTNPNTGLAWTLAELIALQAGPYISMTSSFGFSYVTQFYAEVE